MITMAKGLMTITEAIEEAILKATIIMATVKRPMEKGLKTGTGTMKENMTKINTMKANTETINNANTLLV